MTIAPTTDRLRLTLHRDLGTVRNTVRRIRQSECCRALLDVRERRASERHSVQVALYVTPVVWEGFPWIVLQEDAGNSMCAFTKDVSLRGVAFTHDEPLDTDYAIVTFDLCDSEPVSLLTEIPWSHYHSYRSYTSGGRFLGITDR